MLCKDAGEKSKLTSPDIQGAFLPIVRAQGASSNPSVLSTQVAKSIYRAAGAVYRGSVAEVAHGKSGRKGLQVARLGQLRHQALGVADKHALLARARAQVQVQAALKALVDEAVICRHLPVSQSNT